MRTVASASEQAFHRQFVGRTLTVLWESSRLEGSDAVWNGLTGNYLRVHTRNSANLANTLGPVRLVALTDGGLQGEIETQKSGG
jgi:threonylcarbamoyladenosine tRNA methylthiotransferase MtaB